MHFSLVLFLFNERKDTWPLIGRPAISVAGVEVSNDTALLLVAAPPAVNLQCASSGWNQAISA
jgi:hypothetical protein